MKIVSRGGWLALFLLNCALTVWFAYSGKAVLAAINGVSTGMAAGVLLYARFE